MKNSKKVISLILSLMMAFMLFGCGATKEEAPAQEAPVEEVQTETSEGTEAEEPAAEAWVPEKDIEIIIPFNAGGSSDVACRVLVEYMNKYSDVDFVVTNLPGSGGQVGMQQCADSAADGYTIVSIPTGWFMLYAMGNVEQTYSDYTPITTWADSYMALVVNSQSDYETYEDLLVAAGEKDLLLGAVAGTLPALAEHVMGEKEGISFNYTDLEETAKQTELLSGRIDAYVDAFASIVNYVESGDFNCLALFSNAKMPGYEDIPSLKELGYDFDPDFLSQRYAFWGPADMDPAAVEYINNVVKQASEDPECQAALQELYYGASWMAADEYAVYCEKVQNDTIEYVEAIFF